MIATSMIHQWFLEDEGHIYEVSKELEATWSEKKKQPGRKSKAKMMRNCRNDLASLSRYGTWKPQTGPQKVFYLLTEQRYFSYSKGETPTIFLFI